MYYLFEIFHGPELAKEALTELDSHQEAILAGLRWGAYLGPQLGVYDGPLRLRVRPVKVYPPTSTGKVPNHRCQTLYFGGPKSTHITPDRKNEFLELVAAFNHEVQTAKEQVEAQKAEHEKLRLLYVDKTPVGDILPLGLSQVLAENNLTTMGKLLEYTAKHDLNDLHGIGAEYRGKILDDVAKYQQR